MFETVELFLAAKSGDELENEDVIRDTADWLVVCDGATDKSGYEMDGSTGGRITAHLTAEAVVRNPSGTGADEIIERINKSYDETFGRDLEELGLDRPSCTFVAIDKKAATVLRVGDVSWSDGSAVYDGASEIDFVHSRMRSVYLEMLLAESVPYTDLLANDPARELIMPSLRKQAVFRNNTLSEKLSFGVIDGTPVPRQFIETWSLDDSVTDVIVATDGYPALQPTLELSEKYLRSDLERDPLRIGTHATTKGVRPGHQSFDDRAYARLRKI